MLNSRVALDETMLFCMQRVRMKEHSKLAILDFGRADLGLFRDLLGRIPCDKALEERAQDVWSIFKNHLLQTAPE